MKRIDFVVKPPKGILCILPCDRETMLRSVSIIDIKHHDTRIDSNACASRVLGCKRACHEATTVKVQVDWEFVVLT